MLGAPTSPRALVQHRELLDAYANLDIDDECEAYLSHFAFGSEMQRHFSANRNSVAGFAGPCWCRWLVLDIDRPNLVDALADARKLVAAIHARYPEAETAAFFSGGKGFHVLLELAHNPAPSADFPHIARTFAEALAASAGVTIDAAIYDRNHIIRLPNTRHPKTGLFKRRIDAEALFTLDIDRIRELAKYPHGEGLPTSNRVPPQLPIDWQEAARHTITKTVNRAAIRRDFASTSEARAPRYLVDFLRFGVPEGERHTTLFRSAAWLAEQGAPASLVVALLTESGRDNGLSPTDTERQIRCGIEHATHQRLAADPMPTDPDAAEVWAIRHESDPLPPDATEFPFGALAAHTSEGGLP